jgi:cytochrome c-type biogenesis protein CcmH
MRPAAARRARVVALALVAALALAVPAAAAAQGCPQTTLADIEDEVMCPICGTPLALATEAPQAQRERAYIERQIADCRSKDEIKRALVAQFGDSVLALPGDEGGDDLADVLVYAIPALGILVALGGIALAVVRWRGRSPRRAQAAGPAADTVRLDTDMDRYDL